MKDYFPGMAEVEDDQKETGEMLWAIGWDFGSTTQQGLQSSLHGRMERCQPFKWRWHLTTMTAFNTDISH